jgi:hypothetical protein
MLVMGKGFKGKTCVYCAAAPAATMDHVFAREFFLVDRRANLPKVPACAGCNGAKSQLEHYLTAVLPFGGQHADGLAYLSEMVPGRLAGNQKLARRLSAGLSTTTVVPGKETPAMTVPIDPEKIGELFALIAKGLLWHHWQVLLPPDTFGVRAEMLSAAGVQFYNQAFAMNSGQRVNETLGNGTFSYEGVQSAENPELSVWRFSVFGGLILSGDPEAPGEISSQIGAMTGSHALLAKLKAMESPQASTGTKG